MTALTYILAITVSGIFLIKATEYFLRSASNIAKYLRVPAYTISALLIAIGISFPEMVMGITSAIDGNPILSFGTVLGSNIVMLTLIPAITILVGRTIRTKNIIKTNDLYYGTLFSLLSLFLSLDGVLSRHDGILLLTGFISYSILILRRRRGGIGSLIDHFRKVNIKKDLILFFISLIIILTTSSIIVKSAETLSIKIGVELAFIGMSLTALGASLPEISFGIQAVRKKKQNELLGNIIGSLVANSSLVLGITSLISPISIEHTPLLIISCIFTILATAVFLRVSKSEEEIDRWEAAILIFIYFLFLLGEYFYK